MTTAALHFVGFKGDEYTRAVMVFGLPDFIHRGWDMRARREIAEGDIVVFANGTGEAPPCKFSFDDSNEDGDPAKAERLKMSKAEKLFHFGAKP